MDEIQARIRRKVQALLEQRKIQTLTEGIETLRPLLFEPEVSRRRPVRDGRRPAPAEQAPGA
jgi:hypothetical protein